MRNNKINEIEFVCIAIVCDYGFYNILFLPFGPVVPVGGRVERNINILLNAIGGTPRYYT